MTALFPRNFPRFLLLLLFFFRLEKSTTSLFPPRDRYVISRERILHRTGQTDEKKQKIGGKSDSKRSQYQPPVKKKVHLNRRGRKKRQKNPSNFREKKKYVTYYSFFAKSNVFPSDSPGCTWRRTPPPPPRPSSLPAGLWAWSWCLPSPPRSSRTPLGPGRGLCPRTGAWWTPIGKKFQFLKMYSFYSTILKGKTVFFVQFKLLVCFLFKRKISEDTGDPLLRNSETLTHHLSDRIRWYDL